MMASAGDMNRPSETHEALGRDRDADRQPGSPQTSGQALDARAWSSGGLGQGPERRRAWLRALGIANSDNDLDTETDESQLQPSATTEPQSYSGTDAIASAAAASADISADTISPSQTSDYVALSSPPNTIDNDEWQTSCFESSHDLKASGSEHEVQWQISESKRSRRLKGSRKGSDLAETDPTPAQTSAEATANGRLLAEEPDARVSQLSQNSFAAVSAGSSGQSTSSAGAKSTRRRKRRKSRASTAEGQSGPNGPVDAELYRLHANFSQHLPSHADERQVELDIKRSFVGFPAADAAEICVRDRRRQQLQDLVVGTLRRHPTLHYYQGYHDVLSVLLLVLCPREPQDKDVWRSESEFVVALTAARRLSLFYLRDFMAEKIDPCLGWLKVVRNCVRRFNPKHAAEVVERAGSLPFFALSWVITLLAHDFDIRGEEVRRIFDVVLIEGPTAILWILAALMTMTEADLDPRRSAVGSGDDDSDGGGVEEDADMLHHSLSQLPKRVAQGVQTASVSGDLDREDSAIIERLLRSAQKVRDACIPATPHEQSTPSGSEGDGVPWQGVMGSRSTLYTWSPLVCDADTSDDDWFKREQEAEACLAPDSAGGQEGAQGRRGGGGDGDVVVVDPYPTPPGSEVGGDDSLYSPGPPGPGGKGRDARKRGDRPASKRILETAGTALFVGVFVVAGAAVMLSSSRGSRSGIGGAYADSRLLNDLSHMGRDLVRLAMAMGG
ncbi:unnamed protein product [Parajaminaea phylloscopi]